jgi:hypothetical protein
MAGGDFEPPAILKNAAALVTGGASRVFSRRYGHTGRCSMGSL